jgi:TP901 family phage tail tape measure protein
LVEGVNGQFDKLGSSILAVGVSAVATESDIIAIATQIASVANIAGFSASELIGFSSALASVGTRPELARGTFTRLFTEIQQSVAVGGDQLNAFARIAGQSVEEFTTAWGAGSGAEQVIAILRGLQAQGKNADQALAQLGITSVRDVPTLLKLAQSVEEVERQIGIANLGFAEGSELQDQYNVITSTLSEKVAVLRNNLVALGAAFGSVSGPLTSVVDALILVTRAFEELLDNPINSAIAGTITSFVGLLGVLGLFGSIIARAGAGALGFATALVEGFEAIGLMKVSMDQATASQVTNTVATENNNKSKLAQAIASVRAAKAQDVDKLATDQNTVAKNGLTVATTRAIAATRAFKAAVAGVAIGAVITGVFFLVDAIFQQAGAAEDAADANEKLAESLGDIAPFMAAVQKDTENFRNATGKAREEFEAFGGSVKANNLEISERGEILAVVTGQEELLAGAAGKTANQLENQTLAIGKNTEALIRQKIAQEFANKALEESIGVQQVEEAVRLRAFIDMPTGAASFEAREAARSQLSGISEQVGIASIFEVVTDPALSEALKAAGFDFQEYVSAVASGNTELAISVAQQLVPAATKLRDSLNIETDAEQITYLNGVIQFSTQALISNASAGSELRESIKRLVFEEQLLAGAFDEGALSVEGFRDALKGSFEELFAPINAQREMEEAVRSLGAAFAEQAPGIVVNSQEMQNAIARIIDTASNEEEAAAGLQGFYNAIVEGGYASREELKLIGDQIIETYTIAAKARLQLLRDERTALSGSGGRSGSGRALQENAEQIRQQEQAIKNIGNITTGTAESAEQANLLAQGYSRARTQAGGTADAVDEIEEETKQAVRTLLDYGSDLESVFSRAFDIRFGRTFALDDIAESFDDLSKSVEDARFELEELQASQSDLSADRGIKEYFLSIAEAYNDTLRAAKLREEIAALDREQAENTKRLEEAQAIAGGDLAGQGAGQRQNRQALLGLVQNYQDYITVLAESGASQDELRAATAQAREEFVQQATELGFQEDIVLQYAQAFDDVTFAINNVPRNITIEFDANPALQALRELNSKLDETIEKTKKLNQLGGVERDIIPAVKPVIVGGITLIGTPSDAEEAFREAQAALGKRRAFAEGGFTGPGGKNQPAGIVHRGEYVIPKQFVNQSTGMPDPSFLAQMQNGMRSYQMGGFVGGGAMGSDGTVMVELSPYDRKLLSDAGNVQLRLNGRVVAEATNQNNFDEARRGSN